ncbi:MAG: sigma-70 region 4 domain-containing protein [Verrucomicrobiae bacterium]|nr:sigma-70 region 4 domain-containing protein [Verrucomicrobiae bacterium]NNJ42647.1 hypothetical protein [Akkermansiaceae bacterium]
MTKEQIMKGEIDWDEIVIPGDEDCPPLTQRDCRDLFWDSFKRLENVTEQQMEAYWLDSQFDLTEKEIGEKLGVSEQVAIDWIKHSRDETLRLQGERWASYGDDDIPF